MGLMTRLGMGLGGGGGRGPDERLYRAVVEAVPEGILGIDGRGRVVFANGRAEAMLRYPPGELLGLPAEHLLPERHRQAYLAERARFDADPKERPFGSSGPFLARRKDGTEIPLDIGLSPLSTPEGPITVALLRDVSDQLAAEREQREANEKTRMFIDEAPIGKAIATPEGRILRVNRAYCELVGYSADELVDKTFRDITHPDDQGLDRELLERLSRGELRRYRREKRYIRRDGTVVHVLVWVSLVRGEAGAPRYLIAQVEDISERWRASEALRASELRYKALIEQAPLGVLVADPDGRYVEANPAACRMLGYDRDELLGKSIADVVSPDEWPRLTDAGSTLSTPGATHVGEWTLKRKDGRLVPSEVSAAVLPDGRWQAFVQDISARKQAEQAVRESEERLRRAQQVARLGSWEWDFRTGEVVRSPELLALYGLSPESDLSREQALLLHTPESEREQVLRQITDALEGVRPYTVEHRVVLPDGSEHVLLQHGEPVVERGVPVRLIGTVLDITELRRAEHERTAALGELRAVLEECPIGITIVREGGRVLEPNAKARQMLGSAASSLTDVAQLVGKLKSPDGVALRFDELPAVVALKGKRLEGRELVFEPVEGVQLPIEVSAAPVLSPAGEVSSVVVVWRDLSPVKELERLRSEWNSIVAHDLRQPLNNINIFTQFLARQQIDWTTQAKEALGQIKQMTSRLSRMTFDLLDLSRLDAGRLSLERQKVDMTTLARECIARASLEASDRPIELRTSGELPAVEGDPDRLSQVLENLLSNALKYGAPHTPVEVELGREGTSVKVSVTNRGKGIAPHEIGLVFERFQRTHASRESGVRGVGLGLSIARGLVEAHGGRMGVQSAPGDQTTFWFTLPTPA